MKKNRLFMLGLVAVFVCILSLTLVSSTFAKYTTSGTITNNTATVAKWGVKVKASGISNNNTDIFLKEYKGTGDQSSNLTVKASNKTLAPGTDGKAFVSITGSPEVSCIVEYKLKIEIKNWTVENTTSAGATSNSEFYFPLVIKINTDSSEKNYTSNVDFSECNDGDEAAKKIVEKIQEALGGNSAYTLKSPTESDAFYYLTKTYNVSDTINISDLINLTWEWPFSTNEADDKKDTALGDAATGANAPKITFEITATVTQID